MKEEILYFKNERTQPERLIERDPRHFKNLYCILEKGYRASMIAFERHAIYVYYKENSSLRIAKKMKQKHVAYAKHVPVSKLINKHAIRAKTLINLERESKKKILCVGDVEMHQALLLVHARVYAYLSSKHQNQIENGIEKMLKYHFHFEDLCHSLKIKQL